MEGILLFLILVGSSLFIAIFSKMKTLSDRVNHLEAMQRASVPITPPSQATAPTQGGATTQAPTPTQEANKIDITGLPAVVPPPTLESPYARRATKAFASGATAKTPDPITADASTSAQPAEVKPDASRTSDTSDKAPRYARANERPRVKSARTSKEWEMLVGGKILNRIGSVAVLLGVVFFLKYAFDNNWITPAMRCIMGGVAGLGLIALGERTRKKGLIVFTQGVVATGVPLLFFSVYAAYNYYTLLPQTVAFLLLVGATVLSLAMSLRHKSLFLAVMSVVFGMLVPALIPSGHINTVALHTYILLLDVGLVAIVIGLQRWRVVMSLAAAGTWLWWALWLNAIPIEQMAQDRTMALVLLVAGGLLFTIADFLCTKSGARYDRTLERILSSASAVTWSYLLSCVVYPSAEWVQASYVFSALIYLGMTWKGVRSISDEKGFALQYIVLALAMFAATVSVIFVQYTVSTGETNSALLHSYILLLDLCLIATVVGLKRWLWVVPIVAVVTWLWWSQWLIAIQGIQLIADRSVALTFIITSGILFNVTDIICVRIGLRMDKAAERMLGVVSSIAWTILLCFVVKPTEEWAQYALLFAGGWFSVSAYLSTRFVSFERSVASQYGALATIVFGAACFFNMTMEETARSLACVALASMWIYHRAKLIAPSIVAIALVVLACFSTAALFFFRADTTYQLLLSERTFTFAVLITALWLMGLRLSISTIPNSPTFSRLLRFASYFLLFIGIHEEVMEYHIDVATYSTAYAYAVRHYLGLALAPLASAVVATALLLFAVRFKKTLLQTASIVNLLCSSFVWLVSTFNYYPNEAYTPFVNTRLLTGLGIITCLAIAYLTRRTTSAPVDNASVKSPLYWQGPAAALALLVVTFQLASLEAVWSVVVDIRAANLVRFTTPNAEYIRSLWNAFHLILSSTWIVYSAVLLIVGFLRQVTAMRIAAITLLGISIMKVFLYDLSYLGQPYRIVSFIALGVILLAASYVYARFKHVIIGKQDEEPASDPSQESAPA